MNRERIIAEFKKANPHACYFKHIEEYYLHLLAKGEYHKFDVYMNIVRPWKHYYLLSCEERN